MLNQKGGNVYRGNAGNGDRMNNNHAFNVVELSKKVDRLKSALDRQINRNEANVAVLKPFQGGGVRMSQKPGMGVVTNCRYCKNNNHSSSNCKFKKNNLDRKFY